MLTGGDGFEKLPGDEEVDPSRPDDEPDMENLSQNLAQLLSTLGRRRGATVPVARDRIPDYKREFGHQKIPVCDGKIKSLRVYEQEVSMMLALCSPRANEKVAPHLVNAASPDFKKRWFRGKYEVSNFDVPGSFDILFISEGDGRCSAC